MIIFIAGYSYRESYWNTVILNDVRTYDFVTISINNTNETGFRLYAKLF
jgi:hypothetical protein